MVHFANYEGVRHKVGNPYDVDSPVTTSSIGDPSISLVDAEAAAGCPAACSPVSLQIAKLFLPNPGSTVSGADPALINFNFNNLNREDNFIKSDYHLNDKNIFTAATSTPTACRPKRTRRLFGPTGSRSPIPSSGDGRELDLDTDFLWVNEVRFGYNRYWQNDNVADYDKSAADYGLNTGVTDPRSVRFP